MNLRPKGESTFKAPSCLFTFLLTLTSRPAAICNQQRHPNSGGRWSCDYSICMCVWGVWGGPAAGSRGAASGARTAGPLNPPASRTAVVQSTRACRRSVCVRALCVRASTRLDYLVHCCVYEQPSSVGLLIVQTGTFSGNLALNKVLLKSCSDRMWINLHPLLLL